MAMEKYHLEYQELSLEELYLASQISLEEQTMTMWKAKLNEDLIYIWQEAQTWLQPLWGQCLTWILLWKPYLAQPLKPQIEGSS